MKYFTAKTTRRMKVLPLWTKNPILKCSGISDKFLFKLVKMCSLVNTAAIWQRSHQRLCVWGKNKEATRDKRMFLQRAKLRVDDITDASEVMSRITSDILVTFFEPQILVTGTVGPNGCI